MEKIYIQMRLIILCMLVLMLLAGCIKTESIESTSEKIDEKNSEKIISIGTISSSAVEKIEIFQPVADYIAEKLSTPEKEYVGKVVIKKTGEEISSALSLGEVDLFVESPITAMQIVEDSGAVIFLRRWKDGVKEYGSVFVTLANSGIESHKQLVGKTIGFEDPESTSGYLLPKVHLLQEGFKLSEKVEPDTIKYVFTNDNSLVWLITKKVDVIAIKNLDYEKLSDEKKAELKKFDETILVPRHVVVHRRDLNPKLIMKIKDILTNMDKDEQGKQILEGFDETTKFEDDKLAESLDLIKPLMEYLD